MDDNQIIDRCRTGDREAFAMIVRQHQPGVLALAWSILGRREEAEDMVQDAFVRAYLKLDEFRPPHNFKNWLYTIVYRRCLDRLRETKIEKKYQTRLAEEISSSIEFSNPENRVEASSQLGPLWRRLSAKERTALALAAVEGWSAAEIAEVLACSASTVRVHVFTAKRKLRHWLKGNSHGPSD